MDKPKRLTNVIGSGIVLLAITGVLLNEAFKRYAPHINYPGDFKGVIDNQKVYLRKDEDIFLGIKDERGDVWHYKGYEDRSPLGSPDRFIHTFLEKPYDEKGKLKTYPLTVEEEIKKGSQITADEKKEYMSWLSKIREIKNKREK